MNLDRIVTIALGIALIVFLAVLILALLGRVPITR
jgi:hypothetical protein